MRYLILGGNGYLGAKITKYLVEQGQDVVCTKRAKSNLSRLAGYLERITWIPATADAVEVAFLYEQFDWVINMACNYGRSTVLYDNVIESNIMFPLAVLNLAAEHNVKNYLTIGTGLPDELNMYSFSKSKFSDFGKFYVEKHNMNFTNLRLEMFYGADEPVERFLPKCLRKMLKNEELLVTEGTQHRDIISSYDVIGVIKCALNAQLTGYHEIPVGTGEAPSIREILEYMKQKTKSESKICFGAVPMRNGEPDCVADTTKLKEIGYVCKYSWKEGIDKMIKEVTENENIN